MRHQPLAFLMGMALFVPNALAGEEWHAPDPGAANWFGYSVATAKGLHIAGAPLENRVGPQTGAAYLVDTSLLGGVETKVTPLQRQTGQRFGWDVDLTGEVLVMGAPGQSSMIGQAYVYERSGANWVQVMTLHGLPGHAGDGFGSSVAIEGDRILVGAPGDNGHGPQSGAVYAFRRGTSLWILDEVLRSPFTGPGDQFGFALDMDGDRAVIGAFSANTHIYNEGAAYVYRWTGTDYEQEAELWAANPRPNSMFSRSVAILGDRIAVGATEDHPSDMRTGSVTLFFREDSGWIHEDRVHAPGSEIGNAFGYSVALKPQGLVVGAPLATSGGVRGGSAHIFHPLGPNWQWTEELEPALPAGAGDYMGVSVCLEQDGALVGAMRRDIPIYDSGAVHLFGPEEIDLPLIVSFCGCDDGGPCGTTPQPDGCENSTGHGATLGASGSTSIARDDLGLIVSGLPRRAPTYFAMGRPGAPTLSFDGQLCISSADNQVIVVESRRASRAGIAVTRNKLLSSANRKGLAILAGSSWTFQAAYYDDQGPCGTQYNHSNALFVTLVP